MVPRTTRRPSGLPEGLPMQKTRHLPLRLSPHTRWPDHRVVLGSFASPFEARSVIRSNHAITCAPAHVAPREHVVHSQACVTVRSSERTVRKSVRAGQLLVQPTFTFAGRTEWQMMRDFIGTLPTFQPGHAEVPPLGMGQAPDATGHDRQVSPARAGVGDAIKNNSKRT